MRIGDWDSASGRVLVIAEIGNNHEGNVETAATLIERAAEAGADAVKFQTFDTDFFVTRAQQDRHARLRGFELTRDEFRELARLARTRGLLFLSTPLDLQSAAFLLEIVDGIKIASSDNLFYPLLDEVARSDLPMIVSTGLLDLDEVRAVVERCRGSRPQMRDPEIAVLHCVTSYPVPSEQANVAAVATMARGLDVPVGYSDHVVGIDASLLAVGCGAKIIEKHFTLDHAFSDFRDHQLSADPDELRELVDRVRAAEVLLGDGVKRLMSCEQDLATAVRRSVAAARDLASGTVLTADDLTWVRPGDGVLPGDEDRLLGGVLRVDVPQGHLIQVDAVEGP